MKFTKISLLMMLAGILSCTDLKESLNEDLTQKEAADYLNAHTDANALLKGCYDGMFEPFQDQARLWALQEHTSDEVLGPTRGGDWDDNGIWRSLHSHTWTPDHAYVTATFNQLLQVVFSTTNAQTFNLTAEQKAEARFLRAFVIFALADGWDQVPFRQPGENLLNAPQVLKGAEALDFVISECNAVIPDLPDGPATRANKDAAKVLLMKAYLNKGTFANRTAPTFPKADMDQVIALADQIIGSAKYSLASNYFDNFAPKNGQISTENIFTYENVAGVSRNQPGNSVRSRWFCTLHYNQKPEGWNGFTTLSDFYDSFEDNDERKSASYTGMTDVGGVKAGFLVGQQFNQNGVALKDRKGNDLAFTREVNPIETGNNLEITGIRVIKYPADMASGDNVDNDLVFYRYADVLLMKAEALFRNNDATAIDIVNQLRAERGATALQAPLTADALLAERGREFYWEGNRRQDQIRFGTFLKPNQAKPGTSGNERLLFPIPASAVAVNPNLRQNPGY